MSNGSEDVISYVVTEAERIVHELEQPVPDNVCSQHRAMQDATRLNLQMQIYRIKKDQESKRCAGIGILFESLAQYPKMLMSVAGLVLVITSTLVTHLTGRPQAMTDEQIRSTVIELIKVVGDEQVNQGTQKACGHVPSVNP